MSIKTSPSIIALRARIESKLGFEITCTRDCAVLEQEMIRFDRRFALSVSTLRRFFGVIKHDSPPSLTSLNSLARYIGAKGFDSWEKLYFQSNAESDASFDLINQSEKTSEIIDTSPDSINKTIRSLELILNQFERSKSFQIARHKILEVNQLTVYLLRLNAFPDWMWKRVNRNPQVRIFLEAFPPMDYLGGTGREMLKDYLLTATTIEEKIYANSLITAGTILTGKSLSAALKGCITIDSLDSNLHPMPQARILGMNLLALSYGVKTETNQKSNFRELILSGIEEETEIWPKWSSFHGVFKLMISPWIILAEDIEFIKVFLVAINRNQYSQGITFNYKWIDISIQVYNAWCLFLVGREKEAISIVNEIDLLKLYIHEERIVSMYYFALTSRLNSGDKKKSSLESLDILTKQTEYFGLKKMLNKLS